MPIHDEKRLMPYSASQMYKLVAGVEDYPAFLPWCKEARILSRDKTRMVADLVVGTKFFHETFTSIVTLDPPRALTVQYCSGPLSHLANAWRFTPKGRMACEVAFHVDFDFRSPLLRAAMNVFFDKALCKMVAAFEARAEALYGAGE